jgi:hypothetical protein
MMNRDSSRSHCIFTVYIETSESIVVFSYLKIVTSFRMISKRLRLGS